MTRAASREPQVPAADLPTREVILDAAERLFSAHGVDGVAVRDLAREMGLTASSLYNHFPGKQALYDAVLERGLGPILTLMAEAWQQGGFRLEHIRPTLDQLISHLAAHPHLARLLQRALLEEPGKFQALSERWIGPLYEQGSEVIAKAAGAAGWEAEDVPHLAIGLFGLLFAYFTNAEVLEGLALTPRSEQALARQRRFVEQAVVRLLGPRPRAASRKERS